MSRLVVDASVAAKWFFPEIHSQAALRFLKGGHDLLAPDLIISEVGSVLWKRIRRLEISKEEASEILRLFLNAPLEIHSSQLLSLTALEIACASGQTFYDCLYLALAFRDRCMMVTADRKFFETVSNGPMAGHICWIEE